MEFQRPINVPDHADLALQIHLERIALHRPLKQIEDASEKADAEELRRWYVEEFIDALPN